MSRLDAIRKIGVVEQTYYRWRKQYGGMGVDSDRIATKSGTWGTTP
ncbi:transposase [Paracoccus sp. 12-3]|nr:transposase [Paracoccus xiamenensis]